jgi:ribosomal protein S18 acetylase RimI-like enzyme
VSSHPDVVIRRATESDLAPIVAMLADDELGAQRESPDDLTPYRRAFEEIDVDPHQLLVVAERDGVVVGTMQLSRLAGLSRKGSSRAQIEGVRVASSERGNALGRHLMEWAADQARAWGCQIVQLTSDKSRTDAHRFYERLGFTASHEGFKLSIETVRS